MTSRQHQDWINRGSPVSGLCRPLAQLRDLLRGQGWTVYDMGNQSHLDAEPPEDHTPYSETGWPGASPKWWLHAIDIMPDGKGAAALTQVGQRLYDARQSGQIAWLKYMNWPSTGSLSRAVQDRWEPGHARGSSSDTGHIHLSSITGCEHLESPFDPLTSVVLTGVITQGDDVSAHLEAVMDAWRNGNQVAADGSNVEPVKWRVSDEAWQKGVNAQLTALHAALGAPAVVDVPALAAALQAAGVGQVDVDQLAAALEQHLPSHITLTGTVS